MTGSFGSIFEMGSTPVLEEAMRFAEVRHRLILSNIANADTPGYRRQDLDVERFHRLLGRAIHKRDRGRPPRLDLPAGVRTPRPAGFPYAPAWWDPSRAWQGPLRHDENNVSAEREMALLAKNAGQYSTYSALLRKGLRKLRAAITERPEEA
ncbi:MAG: flagellar basal body rod protein FlgB [Planctomycetota bacterium]